MIRVAVVDDHPALRTGLETVLRSEPGIVPVGSASSIAELWPMLNRSKPDVVLLDYHLPGEDGLVICRRIKEDLLAPRVLLYTAYAGSSLSIPAAVAGADGVISKGVPARELYEALRRVSRGEPVGAPVQPELLEEARGRLEPDHLPILGMVLNGTPMPEIAETLGLARDELRRRTTEIIERLRVEVPEFGS